MTAVDRRTVDLSAYPDLVVIYLGMRVNTLTGLKTLAGFGPQISQSVAAKPDGLLLHENFMFSLMPPHAGMRQYWRDFDALERWARSTPHQTWWRQFLRNSGGTGFWHEAYFMRGGMEAVYDDMVKATGFLAFAPARPARGAMFSARGRALRPGSSTVATPLDEQTLYPTSEDKDPSL
jgi:fumigallin biosynthesis monooxygenase-like protein